MLLEKSVELIEAAPRSALNQTDKNTTHCLVVKALVAVEDQNLSSERRSQRLDTLGLARACRSVGVSSVAHFHPQNEVKVALVSKGRIDKLGRIAQVLKGVVKERITHTDHRLFAAAVDVVLQLFVPHPVARLLACHDVLVLSELVDHVDIVDEVQNQRLDFGVDEGVSLVVELGVSF